MDLSYAAEAQDTVAIRCDDDWQSHRRRLTDPIGASAARLSSAEPGV